MKPKQTAVEFLHSEYKRIFGDVLVKQSQGIEISNALEQAKEMERQQINNAYDKGYKQGYYDPYFDNEDDE